MKYAGRHPKRRIAKKGYFTASELAGFAAAARYVGSAHHKSRYADYGFHPPANPRASKSLCDGLRVVRKADAEAQLQSGFARGMVSQRCPQDGLPKFVWAVDGDGEVYEAKLGGDGHSYHGYRLGRDDIDMCKWVTKEWRQRAN